MKPKVRMDLRATLFFLFGLLALYGPSAAPPAIAGGGSDIPDKPADAAAPSGRLPAYLVNRSSLGGQMNTFIEKLEHAPYPYSGRFGDAPVNFWDAIDPATGERFHTNRYGVRFSERDHYSDSSVLFHVPPGFNPHRPFTYVLFFHELATDVVKSTRDHGLERQIDASGRNVILVAPQLARSIMDSSPGKFFRRDSFKLFMREVADVLAARLGLHFRNRLRTAPLILTAFSGGYKAVAFILDRGGTSSRIQGIFLMDSLYEDVEKYENWVIRNHRQAFLVGLYKNGESPERNMHDLSERLARRSIHAQWVWPQTLRSGTVHFAPSPLEHMEIPLLGPPAEPLACLLRMAPDSRSVKSGISLKKK